MKNAGFRILDSPYRVVAWRPQGDVYRWYIAGLPSLHPVSLIDAIQECISGLLPLSVSEALEAGERRRTPDRWR